MSEWGKCMQKKNKHKHKLSDCGYLEKCSAKEDDSAHHTGKAAPFSRLKPVCRKDFMRACTKYSRATEQLIFIRDEVAQVHEKVVDS
jgi:hypothetical protein